MITFFRLSNFLIFLSTYFPMFGLGADIPLNDRLQYQSTVRSFFNLEDAWSVKSFKVVSNVTPVGASTTFQLEVASDEKDKKPLGFSEQITRTCYPNAVIEAAGATGCGIIEDGASRLRCFWNTATNIFRVEEFILPEQVTPAVSTIQARNLTLESGIATVTSTFPSSEVRGAQQLSASHNVGSASVSGVQANLENAPIGGKPPIKMRFKF